MRLLHAKKKTLEEFFEKDVPPYAILSHTWGKDEVLFKDITKGRYNNDSEKIEGCCREALMNGIAYVWIDTCCIDKRSSAELSEAINSMFDWYQEAKVCYAYLADVYDKIDVTVPESTIAFRQSRWWTRGWTLQELLAPKRVEFYNASWTHLGAKFGPQEDDSRYVEANAPPGSINSLIGEITGIKMEYLNNGLDIYIASVAERMSWAAQRHTTRVEDNAYSLLGIFAVNIPLLYGEKEGAFRRLQEAIIASSDDQTIFVWKSGLSQTMVYHNQLLANSPSDFGGYGNIVRYTPGWVALAQYSMTNVGLQIAMPLRKLPGDNNIFIGLLNCAVRNNEKSQSIAIVLITSPNHTGKNNMAGPFITCSKRVISISSSLFQYPDNDPNIPICIRSEFTLGNKSGLIFATSVGTESSPIEAIEVYPPTWHTIVDDQYVLCRYNPEQNNEPFDFVVDQQNIYLHCLLDIGKHFVVRLKYKFSRLRAGYGPLFPLTIEIAVAEFESGLSLAETLIVHSDQVDMGLVWKQKLDLDDGNLSFHLEKTDTGAGISSPFWTVHPQMNRPRANEAKLGDQVLPNAHGNILADVPTKSCIEEQRHLSRKRKR